jgi:CRISPR-associated protein Csc2
VAHDPQLVSELLQSAFDDRVDAERGGLDLKRVPDETVDDLLEAATGNSLADVLETQLDASRAFLEQTA